ncbi:hypothetical protein GCM10010885_22880 [Alicyclobacillus cellulosilyticus]|uniref:DCC family thiol-disulfide oxidoreductase YuxK n=1 Tax=Alicyclobacillus cellulosilyticus TaxID=1003997 RepID=A0A917KG43_9BACL|nr:DCC1-like thiol-disulfide oxidoreductase family protein [Alicyclobacillus cellulosilyticus]GGJ13005.1 hypothetical protein GCM10010885_22880 [Alicyclobacillus cellulosilyticus]
MRGPSAPEAERKLTPFTVFVDTDCALCRLCANWLRRCDTRHIIRFVSARDGQNVARCGLDPWLALEEIHIQSATGEVRTGVDGLVWLFAHLPVLRRLVWLYHIPGVPWLARRLYRRIARRRLMNITVP